MLRCKKISGRKKHLTDQERVEKFLNNPALMLAIRSGTEEGGISWNFKDPWNYNLRSNGVLRLKIESDYSLTISLAPVNKGLLGLTGLSKKFTDVDAARMVTCLREQFSEQIEDYTEQVIESILQELNV